jgi:membrane protein YqaA with SNARE-associated domain
MIVLATFVWAFAEAYVWPIVPDAALAVAVFTSPELAPWAVGAVVVGSTVGGATAILAYRRGGRWPLPLVTTEMQRRVHEWMGEGVVGLRHQPLTAVPYKAFVIEAAERRLGISGFAALTVVFRGLRMAATAGLALVVSHGVGRWSPPGVEDTVRLLVVGTSLAGFLIGWRLTHQMWAKSESTVEKRSGGTPAIEPHTMR